ncbi:hypothetical protein C8R47DRAFT_263541 [Mycena vitilis]|nr:hypothetical protein C8R47DRAFT_263541 [Mycena vitilis]
MGCCGQERLMVSDPVAMSYIVNTSSYFGLGPELETVTYWLHGEKSVAAVKEEAHKRLRAALNIGFTAAAVQSYMPIVHQAAQTLVEQLDKSSSQWANVCPHLSLAALSTMSRVVLGYSIKDLGEEFMVDNLQVVAIASKQSSAQLLRRRDQYLASLMVHRGSNTHSDPDIQDHS